MASASSPARTPSAPEAGRHFSDPASTHGASPSVTCSTALMAWCIPAPRFLKKNAEKVALREALLFYTSSTQRGDKKGERTRGQKPSQRVLGILDGVQRGPNVVVLGLQEPGEPSALVREAHGQHLGE